MLLRRFTPKLHTMRSVIILLCFCITTTFTLAQGVQKSKKVPRPPSNTPNIHHIGVYAGYNSNSIDNGALNRLTQLQNGLHAAKDYNIGYKDFLRMRGWSAGFMAWQGKVFADVGFDIRQSSLTARFRDIPNEFQTQTLSMNSFHLGLGMNTSDGSEKVCISPGLSFGMGKLIIKEINYRTELNNTIPANQTKPIGVKDDSKNMASLNMYGTAFVNFMIGNPKKGPKFIIQPYLTLPFVKNDLTRAFYPSDFKGSDPNLKSRIVFWGMKVAVSL